MEIFINNVTSITITGIGCDPEPEETTRNTGYHGDYYTLQLEVGYSREEDGRASTMPRHL